MKNKKGFDYYLEREILEDYGKKPLELRLRWLYYANKFRKYYPKEIIERQEKFRKGRNMKKENFSGRRFAILTHWDADGLASAVILRNWLEKSALKPVDFLIPPLGSFSVDEDVMGKINKSTVLFVCDFNLPESEFLRLSETAGLVVSFDHHIKKERLKGIIDFRKQLPSATEVLRDVLNLPSDFFVKVGLAGDSPTAKGKIKNFANLLDVAYKANSRQLVLRVLRALWKNKKNPEKMFELNWLLEKRERIKKEVSKIKKIKGKVISGVLVKHFATKYNVISEAGRALASTGKWKAVILINYGFFRDKTQFYARVPSGGINMAGFINRAKGLGYNCGGKRDVAGAIVPARKIEAFVELCIKFLRGAKK